MALPPGFGGSEEYFDEFFSFLRKYEYLFNFPNTDVLLNDSLNQIELDVQQINTFDRDFHIRRTNSEYLTDFFYDLDKLTVNYEEFTEVENLELTIDVSLCCAKKRHEIAYLAEEIGNVCKAIGCDTVVDFGSGLGYLDDQLFKTTDYNVLGLECKETNYVCAKKRQRKYNIESIERVKYIKHTILPESHRNIKDFLDDKFPNSKRFCIAGLHACADLTVDAINIFLKMENAVALVIMPCCYHRIISENGKFKNFPLSEALKKVCEKASGSKYLTVPFLRLATQPMNKANDNLKDLVFNLLARAVLQVYANKHGCKLKRNKRKAVRLKTLENNFGAYAADALKGFKLLRFEDGETKDYEKKIDLEELDSIWGQITQRTLQKAAIFVLLQNSMQPAFENFVLYDRLVYLRENGVANCRVEKIVNEKISPRCLGLLAHKV